MYALECMHACVHILFVCLRVRASVGASVGVCVYSWVRVRSGGGYSSDSGMDMWCI